MMPVTATIVIDDDRIRVTTWTFPGDGETTGRHRHEFDYVVVPVSGGQFRVTDADGSIRTMTQTAGAPYLGSAGTDHEVASVNAVAVSFVEVELKA
jgi:beta-alanine degradation protein BauB